MDKKNTEISQEDTFHQGPLSLLREACKRKNQIIIYCRNNRKLLGQLRAFDRHMNMILENVCELWTEISKTSKGKKPSIRNRERKINKLFLRGDSVILVAKKPTD